MLTRAVPARLLPPSACKPTVIVAIDGPAGAGKSTIARRLAEKLGWVYIDTGAMYRAVALKALQQKIPLDDADRLKQLAENCQINFEPGSNRIYLDGEDVTEKIRTAEVGQAASIVASHDAVRRVLVEKQRALALNQNVIMEGRDIGTVVFPEAEVKIFLDASPETRAWRRWKDLQDQGEGLPFEQVLAQVRERDERDRSRPVAPLKPASDAVIVDTTNLTLEEVEQKLLALIWERLQKSGSGATS